MLGFDDPVPISNAGLAGTLSNMAVGDFDGDGHVDIAIGMVDSSKIWVSYGLGGGLFDVPKSFYSGPRPATIHAASLGSDTPMDLVVGGSGAIVVLNGIAGESFSAPETLAAFGGTPKEIASADFDNDGIQDVAATVYFPPGQGDVTALYAFAGYPRAVTAIEVTSGGDHIAAGNVAGNSNMDVVVTGSVVAGTVGIFRGNGDGTFQPPDEAPMGNFPGPIGLADLDLDGDSEIGVAFNSNPGLWMIRWQPSAPIVLDSTYAEGYPVSCVATGDLNLDGRDDFAVGSFGNADSWILVNDGNRHLKPPFAASTGGTSNQIAVADVDGDGKNDVVLAYLAIGGYLRYLRNTTH